MTLKMIKTDWFALKSRYWMTIIPLVLMIIAIIASGFIGIWLTLFAAYAACGGAMDPFIVEQKGKLQHFYLSLPLSRKSIVNGRYAFMLLYVFGLMILFGGVTVLSSPVLEFGGIRYEFTPPIIIMLAFIGFAVSGVFNCIAYPIMFRLGYEKGKMFGFYVPLCFSAVLLGLFNSSLASIIRHTPDRFNSMFTYLTENAKTATLLITLIALGVGLVLYFISYCISQRVYARRSF
jgi:hypothetical protein